MRPIDWLLGRPMVYRAWQHPFVRQKLAPLEQDDIRNAHHVLDVGCGPGTNATLFAHTEYLGIDLNPEYIAEARERKAGRFQVGDAARLDITGSFDFILANSLYHHLDDPATDSSLAALSNLLAPDGHVHILDLLLPSTASPARLLARWDRGDFPRPVSDWRSLFTRHFELERFEPYSLTCFGVALWHMVYFKGSKKG